MDGVALEAQGNLMGFLQGAALMEACSAGVLQAMSLCLNISPYHEFSNETIPMKFKLSICSLWLDFACIRCTNNYAYPQAMKLSSSLNVQPRIEQSQTSPDLKMKLSPVLQSLAAAFQIPFRTPTPTRPSLSLVLSARPSLQASASARQISPFSSTTRTLARGRNQPKGDRRISSSPSHNTILISISTQSLMSTSPQQ